MRARLKHSLTLGAALAVILFAAGATALAQNTFLLEVPAEQAPAPQPAPAPVIAKPAPANPSPAVVRKPAPAPKSAPQAAPEPALAPLSTDGQQPDESALRYYASLQQTQRVETEIKRLKRLYPHWQPPENLSSVPTAGGVDEQPLWDLFGLNQMERLHAEIARRKKAEPEWQPSEDLMDKIRRKEVRNQISALWQEGKWKDLIAYVKDTQMDVSDADIDIVWTIAEAYARAKQTADAIALYKSIMQKNGNAQHRIATVQKAMAVMRMTDVEEIIAIARKDANGKSELDGIAIDITRGRISAYLHDERKDLIPAEELNRFEEYARQQKDPNQPGLVAWYHYKNQAAAQALEWFKFAIAQGGDAMIAHGLAHALRELGLYRDTEEVTYAWRQPLVHNAILFIDILERDLTKEIPPYIEPHRLKRYAEVTMDTASGEGAQGLAWYAYNTCQFQVALEWFERAVAWLPKEATVYGYALALRRMKKSKEFWEVMNRYDGLFPKVIEIIYPDGYYHPPTPCDMINNKNLQRQYVEHHQSGAAFSPPAPYMPGQPLAGGPQQINRPMHQRGPVVMQANPQIAQMPGMMQPPGMPPQIAHPSFQQKQQAALQPPACSGQPLRAGNPLQNDREPRIDRKLFPVAVDPQNPLRHYPAGRFMGPPAQAAMQMPAPQTMLTREPVPGMAILVARRVPGVGGMPYER